MVFNSQNYDGCLLLTVLTISGSLVGPAGFTLLVLPGYIHFPFASWVIVVVPCSCSDSCTINMIDKGIWDCVIEIKRYFILDM